jgi:GTP-binding protein
MPGIDGRTPWEDLAHLRNELELYMKGLSKRPAVIVANKMDVEGAAENLELLKGELSNEVIDIVPVSAESGDVTELKNVLRRVVEASRKSFDF